MFDAVKDHPVPALVAGLSLGYLVLKAGETSGRDRDYARRRAYAGPYGDPYGRRPDLYRRPENRGGYAYDYEDDAYEDDEYGFRTFYRNDEFDRNRDYADGAYDSPNGYLEDDEYPGDYAGANTDYDASAGEDHSVKERLAETADDVKERAEHLADETRRRVRRAGRQVRRGTRRTRSGIERFLHENPLAAGTLALGVGALLGGLLPSTEKENEWMGSTRDRVVHRAETAAEEAADRARHIASRVADETRDSVQEVKNTARVEVRRVGEAAKEEVAEAKESPLSRTETTSRTP